MCKLQNSYYNQCDHRIFRVTSVCRNRELPGSKCREATNLYFPGQCGPCTLEEQQNETPQAQQSDGRFVEIRNPAETSDTTVAEPYPSMCLEHLPALPDSPISSEHEHSPSQAAQQEEVPEALQQLKLTDRFNAPAASTSTPTFNTVSYATLSVPQSNHTHKLPQRNSVQSLIEYYNGLDSGYESSDSSPVSPSSSSPLTFPTTSSSNPRLTILRDLWDFDNTGVRSHTIGRKHARCKVKCKKPEVKDDGGELADLHEVRCKYGTHRVLDQPGDLLSKESCGWHDAYEGMEEQGWACKAQNEDVY
ncbi:hypothetical protein E8E11_011267 [Didymella keratinophila]|nr:hypothetical protein E8E11_011267 [Didymella keratinophila]